MLFLHSFSGSARVSCIVSLDIVWCLECSTSSHLKVNKSLRKSTRKISFPCMTLRSVLANLMLVSGTCISEDEQGFPDPTEKEREVLVSGLWSRKMLERIFLFLFISVNKYHLSKSVLKTWSTLTSQIKHLNTENLQVIKKQNTMKYVE